MTKTNFCKNCEIVKLWPSLGKFSKSQFKNWFRVWNQFKLEKTSTQPSVKHGEITSKSIEFTTHPQHTPTTYKQTPQYSQHTLVAFAWTKRISISNTATPFTTTDTTTLPKRSWNWETSCKTILQNAKKLKTHPKARVREGWSKQSSKTGAPTQRMPKIVKYASYCYSCPSSSLNTAWIKKIVNRVENMAFQCKWMESTKITQRDKHWRASACAISYVSKDSCWMRLHTIWSTVWIRLNSVLWSSILQTHWKNIFLKTFIDRKWFAANLRVFFSVRFKTYCSHFWK